MSPIAQPETIASMVAVAAVALIWILPSNRFTVGVAGGLWLVAIGITAYFRVTSWEIHLLNLVAGIGLVLELWFWRRQRKNGDI